MRNQHQRHDSVAETSDFWQCEACGCQRMRHVQVTDAQGQVSWHNRCLHCNHDSEYIPTPQEIAYETAKIRAETGRLETDDDHERFWHAVQAEQLATLAEDDDLNLDELRELL